MKRSATGGNTVIEGIKALEATLKGLRTSVQKRIMRNTVNRGLVIVAGEIRKSVPQAITPGHDMRRVKKSVGVKRQKAGRENYLGKAGLGVGKNGQTAPLAHLIPLGTAERRTKAGASRGKITPRSFVPEAAAKSESKALAEMQKTFRKNFEKEAEKEARKNRGKK